MKENSNIIIRTASVNDAEILLNIYAPYVDETVITFEYEVPSLSDFRNRIENTLKRYPYIVAEYNGEICGYAYLGVFKARSAYQWTAETSIYIRRGYHGMGIGRKLYQEIERIAISQNMVSLNACISYSEVEDEYLTKDSVRFHERLGYRICAHFHKCGYKFGNWYDVVWMEKHLAAFPEKPAAFIPFPELNGSYKSYRRGKKLLLEKFEEKDKPLYEKLVFNEQIMKANLGRVFTEEEAEMFFQAVLFENDADRNLGYYKVSLEIDGSKEFAGLGALSHNDEFDALEVEYMLLPEYWNKGIGTQVLNELMSMANQYDSSAELIGITDPENAVSIKMLEHAGFYLEKEFINDDGEPAVLYRYGRKKGPEPYNEERETAEAALYR